MTFYLSSFFSGLKSGINSFSVFLGLSWWVSFCKGYACSARNSEDSGLIPGSGRSPGRRNGNPLQYSWLENPIDKGVWWVAVHGVAKSWIQLSSWVHSRAGTHTPIQSLSWSFLTLTLLKSCCCSVTGVMTLCDPMDCRTPGFLVLHYLLEFAQVHVHWGGGPSLSNHLILCHSFLLLLLIFPRIKVFSRELALHKRWPKYWSFSFSISPSNEYSGLNFWVID